MCYICSELTEYIFCVLVKNRTIKCPFVLQVFRVVSEGVIDIGNEGLVGREW